MQMPRAIPTIATTERSAQPAVPCNLAEGKQVVQKIPCVAFGIYVYICIYIYIIKPHNAADIFHIDVFTPN